jgi:hypothetical protein
MRLLDVMSNSVPLHGKMSYITLFIITNCCGVCLELYCLYVWPMILCQKKNLIVHLLCYFFAVEGSVPEEG